MLYPPVGPPVGSPSYAGNSVGFSRTANSAWPKLIRIGRRSLAKPRSRRVLLRLRSIGSSSYFSYVMARIHAYHVFSERVVAIPQLNLKRIGHLTNQLPPDWQPKDDR
jgi:hypothetical protein